MLPHDDFLIAEVAGEAWAAIGLRSRVLIADPFRPSGQLAELLRMRVARPGGRQLLTGLAMPFRRVARQPVAGSSGC